MTEQQLQQVSVICRKYGVIELTLFGSRAAGDARPDSDYDFLYKLEPGTFLSLTGFLDLKEEIERVLGLPVDLVNPEDVVNPYVRAHVFATTELIYAAH
jgi:uncharacterized protein